MCDSCWAECGRPVNWSPAIAETLGLVRDLYAIHSVGGPLHVVLDDWNIDGVIRPWYDGYDGVELDALWFGGVLITELDPAAPAVVEGLGRSMRQLCDQIAARFNTMTVEDRASVLAYHDGFAAVPEEDGESRA